MDAQRPNIGSRLAGHPEHRQVPLLIVPAQESSKVRKTGARTTGYEQWYSWCCARGLWCLNCYGAQAYGETLQAL